MRQAIMISPGATPYPVVQGYEYSATVEAVGEKAVKAKSGMKAYKNIENQWVKIMKVMIDL